MPNRCDLIFYGWIYGTTILPDTFHQHSFIFWRLQEVRALLMYDGFSTCLSPYLISLTTFICSLFRTKIFKFRWG